MWSVMRVVFKYYITRYGAQLPNTGLTVTGIYGERQYIPEIDRMAYGWVTYTRRLMPWEIARAGLILQPREDE